MKKALMMCFMLVIAFMMVGCSNDNDNTILYNAVMVNSGSIDTAQTVNYFKKDFLLENKVSGVRYKNENYDPTNPESEEYIFDESSPETITYVLDSLDKYESSENNYFTLDDLEKANVTNYSDVSAIENALSFLNNKWYNVVRVQSGNDWSICDFINNTDNINSLVNEYNNLDTTTKTLLNSTYDVTASDGTIITIGTSMRYICLLYTSPSPRDA